MNFKNKKILVMGLGLHGGGIGVVKWLYKQGAKITVTDIKSKKELGSSLHKLNKLRGVIYHLGGHKERDFKICDIVIKGPGVPIDSSYLKIARLRKAPILSDVGIFLDYLRRNYPESLNRIIGITGTKGKSTTATLIAEVLKQKFFYLTTEECPERLSLAARLNLSGHSSVFLLGNIRASVLESLPKIKNGDWIVLELSSFQLEDAAYVKFVFSVAVLTSLFPDHLDRHKTFNCYKKAKRIIFKYQNKNQLLVANTEDKNVRDLISGAKARIISLENKNFSNNAAKAVGEYFNISKKRINDVLKSFKGPSGRLEKILEKDNIVFINDTTATNPTAAVYGIKQTRGKYSKKQYPFLVIIAGGSDKNLPVSEFVSMLEKYADKVIFLPGKASEKMIALLKIEAPNFSYGKAVSMREAVLKAYTVLRGKEGIVLLSPGAASFGIFKHEFDRGDKFIRAVRKIQGML